MRSTLTRPNLSSEQRELIDRLVARVQGIEADVDGIARDTAGLVVGSVGSGTSRDEAFWLARAARSGGEADAASRQTEFALTMAKVGAPMHRPNPAARRTARPNLTPAEADLLHDIQDRWGRAEALEAVARQQLETVLGQQGRPLPMGGRSYRPNPRGARPNVTDSEGAEIADVLRGWLDAERQESQARDKLIGMLPAGYDPEAFRANPGSRHETSRRMARPNLSSQEYQGLTSIRRRLMAAGMRDAVAREEEQQALADLTRLIGASGVAEPFDAIAARRNPAAHVAHQLDAEFSKASPHEREAVRRTLRVLAETGARDNPIGVTALALALPNPAGPNAVPPFGSDHMASQTYKNPARVLAGKMAWHNKSAAEKNRALAALHGGQPRDNISRPRWEILSSMGMAKAGPVEQFGGIPPFLSDKQAKAFADAVAWRLMPVKAPKMSTKKSKAKPLTPEEKAKRAENATKREANLGKSLARLEKQLSKGGVSGDALNTAVAALKKAKEESIQAYKEGVRLGQSSSIYARSPGSFGEDATLQGYLARVEKLLASKKAKSKSSSSKGPVVEGKGLGLWSAAAKRADAAAWAKAKAQYDADIKGADAATKRLAAETAIAEYQSIAAKKNPGGISGFKGWAKTVGYGLGGFVAGSALSNLIDRVTSGSMGAIARYGVPLAGAAAVYYFGKSWSPEMRYGLIGGMVAAAFLRPMLLGLLSKIPVIGGIFASIAGGSEAAPAGQSGIGDLYDEAFGVQGYVLGDDDDDDGLDGYVLGDDDDDDGLDGYVLGDDDDDDDGMGAYVLSGDDDDDDDLAGDVNDGTYDWSNRGTSGFEEAVAGGFEEAVAGVGNFEEAVAGDDDDGGELTDADQDLEEAEAMSGMGDAEVKRQVGGWARLAQKYGKSVAYLKRNFKVLTMTPQSARNIVQAGRGKVIGRSRKYQGMILVLFRMTRQGQPRGPIERGAQVVRKITARRPEDLAIRRPMGGAIAPGGIFQTSIFGTRPQYTQQGR